MDKKKTTLTAIEAQKQDVDEAIVRQLALFTDTNSDANTLIGYDIRPRFIHTRRSKVQQLTEYQDSGDKFIFLNDGSAYSIQPAVIDRDKGKIAVFPGTRESLVEEAIMSFASNREFDPKTKEPGYVFDGGSLKVMFTLYQLWNFMAKNSKTYAYDELQEALIVLMRAGHWKGKKEDYGDGKLRKTDTYESYITGLKFVDNDTPDEVNVKVDKYFSVTLNPAATKLITKGAYKLYDDKKSLKMKSPIARFLYKKIIQQVKRHAMDETFDPIELDQNQCILASGYQIQDNATKKKMAFQAALDELQKQKVLKEKGKEAETHEHKEGRAIIEITYTVHLAEEMAAYMHKVYARDDHKQEQLTGESAEQKVLDHN